MSRNTDTNNGKVDWFVMDKIDVLWWGLAFIWGALLLLSSNFGVVRRISPIGYVGCILHGHRNSCADMCGDTPADACQRFLRTVEILESKHWFRDALDQSVVLLNDVVKVLALPDLNPF